MLGKTIRENQAFFIPYFFLLIFTLPVFFLFSKAEIHLWLNQYHSPIGDFLFRYLTWLGDGFFVAAAGLGFLLISRRKSFFILAVYLSAGLVTQLLKRLAFPDVLRPSRFFTDNTALHTVEGVRLLGSRSFPSGHATSAFAFFLCLALISGKKWMKLVCFFMACLVAYSRVYLSQHFLMDIYVGSVIGSAVAVIIYIYFYREKTA